MLARIIFCTAASIAILIVVLLALYSPVTHRKPTKNKPWLALSLYIQQSRVPPLIPNVQPATTRPSHGALIFHRKLTEGPENTSRVVGKAQGFIIPVQHFSNSDFNLICLTFDTRQYSGSLSVESKNFAHKEREKNSRWLEELVHLLLHEGSPFFLGRIRSTII
ncbi:hypothetical protein Acr_10g0006770 [Actinidia rufa]|uniref:Dirigent protein n=1 Tax=Actinidia rufa TaxID=165716 RepID=A0A7J0F9A8_9ERIC|nr:hypothetical protein Acr_10g0006770 [Actinidia rufa]